MKTEEAIDDEQFERVLGMFEELRRLKELKEDIDRRSEETSRE